MVFKLLASLFSILSSCLVYIAAALFFSKTELNLVAFAIALILIQVLLFIIRLLFTRGRNKMKHAAGLAHSMGGMRRRFQMRFKHAMERRLISGNVARIIAFGTIMYLALSFTSMIYIFGVFALVTGIIMVLAHRSKIVDLVLGVLLGFAAGFFSLQYADLIMKAFGI
jgi:hypothetical protein